MANVFNVIWMLPDTTPNSSYAWKLKMKCDDQLGRESIYVSVSTGTDRRFGWKKHLL